MTLSLQEISDRFEIQDLVANYADIIDRKDFDQLATIFTEGAHIDYSAFGGAIGNRADIIKFLKEAMGAFPNSQHLVANIQISFNSEDSASGKVMCFNPMEMDLGEGKNQTFMLGLWYLDDYTRTADGWRISKRVEEKSWTFNVPEFMNL